MLIGVEIGGTKLQLAVGERNGRIVRSLRGSVDRARGSAGILEWIEQNLGAMLAKERERGVEIEAIGVGFGGPIETSSGCVLKSVQVKGWAGFGMKQWFEEKFNLTTYVFNDSSAAG